MPLPTGGTDAVGGDAAPPDDGTAPRRRSTDRTLADLAPVAELPLPLEAARGGRRLAPLVGRETEMGRITSTWSDPGARRVLAVSGDAGIGKSRLVAELATVVHGDGGLVLWGACAEQGGSAYRPFVEALRPLAIALAAQGPITAGALGPGGPHLLRLVPELAPGTDAGEPTSTGDERGPLFDTVTSVLRHATAGRPTLLVVDDLHWADASTCALLVHLARAPELAHVILAVTYRAAETTHPEPAARMLAELRRLRVVEQVPLAGLDAPATAELVAALSVGDEDGIDPARAAELHDRTDGNPFFVEELVAHEREAGGEGLPVAVVDIVERRLADLDPEHRRVLAAAAVLGRAFDTALLAATADVPEADLLDPLDEAIHHQLVTEAAPPVGRFEFAHALIRDGLLDGMTALRRSRLHLAAADAIDAMGAPPELFSQRSHHLVAAGSAVPTERLIAALHATADQALKVAAYDEAEAACSLALERIDLAEGSAEAVDILLVLGLVRIAVGDLPGARKVFRWAADAARALGDGRRLGLAATGLGTGSGVGVAYELGVVDEERVEWLEEALTLIAPDEVHLRTRFLAHLGVALYDGDPVRRGEVTAEALALAEELGDPTYTSAAYIARRIDLWTPDADLDERLEVGELAIRHADEGGDPLYTIVTRIAALADLLDAADLDRYDELHAEAEVLARPLRQKRWDWFLDVSRGCRALSRGEFEEAEATIDGALEGVGDAMGTVPVLTHAAARVVLDRDLGRHADIIEMVTVLAADAVGPPPSVFVASTAVILAEMGDLEGAAALAGPYLAGDVEHMRPDYLWAITVGWFAEVAHRLDDAEGAARCSALLVGHERRLLALGGSAAGGLGARPAGTGGADDRRRRRGRRPAPAGPRRPPPAGPAPLGRAQRGRAGRRAPASRRGRRRGCGGGPRPGGRRGGRRPRDAAASRAEPARRLTGAHARADRRARRHHRPDAGVPPPEPTSAGGTTGSVRGPRSPPRRARCPATGCASARSSARTTRPARTRPSPCTATSASPRPSTGSASTSCGSASTTPAAARSSAARRSSWPPRPSAPAASASAPASCPSPTTTPSGWRSGSSCSTT